MARKKILSAEPKAGPKAGKEAQPHAHAYTLEQAVADLKKAGLKLTVPRQAILKALVEDHGPFTVEQIHKIITKKICDQATVYRILSNLCEAGLVRRCEFGDGSARFELAGSGEHHHHVVCRKCQRVEVIDDREIEEIDRFPLRHGFADISHILEFFGTCPRCQ